MTTGGRLSAAAALAAIALGATAPAVLAAERFVTADGREVTLSAPEGMSCPQLLDKIVEIDATGYRGRRPAPAKAHDRRLLAYEKAVSRRYYTRCAGGGAASVSDVLRRGLASAQARD